MALTEEEKQELIIANQNVHHDLVGTIWKYTYKNGKGYVIYEFETAATLTWTSYNSDNVKEKSYCYSYIYENSALKIIWNPKNLRSGFDIYEVTADKIVGIVGRCKNIIIDRM